MPNPREEMVASFDPSKVHQNYGEALLQLHIKGFRIHQDTLLRFESPVTAICGVNGTGKSTVLQLAAAAYSPLVPSRNRYYISSFMIAGSLGNRPFVDSASLEVRYAEKPGTDGKVGEKLLTLSRSGSGWSGYDRQPGKSVLYLGLGFYVPYAERDTAAKKLLEDESVTSRRSSPLHEHVVKALSTILRCKYDASHTHEMRRKYARNHIQITTAQRNGGVVYTEANMGSGEARLYAMLRCIESLPEKSLLLIEEPETSLHPSAQMALGQYFVEVALRRKLQIIMTTHSEFILLALPSRGRIYLKREDTKAVPIPRIGVRQAVSMMDANQVPALYVLVEDDVAEAIVRELLRIHDVDFLKTVRFIIAGDKDNIQRCTKVLEDERLPVCAVRDGDCHENAKQHLYKLFGSLPPEKEMFSSKTFREKMRDECLVNWEEADIVNKDKNHHLWLDILANQMAKNRAEILPLAAGCYLAGVSELDRKTLVNVLKESVP